jgi:tryptophan 2,3-dioxygenase
MIVYQSCKDEPVMPANDACHGDLDHAVNLRTRELLGLQTPVEELVVPDEWLFQIQHQTQELWLKCAAFETAILVEELDAENGFQALTALDRIVLTTRCLGEQMRVLFSLSPSQVHVIRRSWGSSGLESPGYHRLLASAEAAWCALKDRLARRGASVLAIYRTPKNYPDLHSILERFIDWDTAVQSWLVEHFMLARRALGIDKNILALNGTPTVELGARMTRPLFPELWKVRIEIGQAWSRQGGCASQEELGA